MMKPLGMFAVLAMVGIATLSMTRTASSEPGGLHLNITPFGGYWDWSKDVNLDNKALFGGRVGIGFGRYLGIEGYYSWMRPHTLHGPAFWVDTPPSTLGKVSYDMQRYGADVSLNLIPGSGFNPYIIGGWFEDQIKPKTAGPKTYMNGMEFGAGLKLGVSKRAAPRREAP